MTHYRLFHRGGSPLIIAMGGTKRVRDGLIDDVRIYNYARTSEQIQQDYNAGFSTHFK